MTKINLNYTKIWHSKREGHTPWLEARVSLESWSVRREKLPELGQGSISQRTTAAILDKVLIFHWIFIICEENVKGVFVIEAIAVRHQVLS